MRKEDEILDYMMLLEKYEWNRYIYNSHTTDELVDEMVEWCAFSENLPQITSPMVRRVSEFEAKKMIEDIGYMLALKKISDKLPDLDSLKNMPVLVQNVLDESP